MKQTNSSKHTNHQNQLEKCKLSTDLEDAGSKSDPMTSGEICQTRQEHKLFSNSTKNQRQWNMPQPYSPSGHHSDSKDKDMTTKKITDQHPL